MLESSIENMTIGNHPHAESAGVHVKTKSGPYYLVAAANDPSTERLGPPTNHPGA